jgi:chromosomal replication initiation ATPase DnaA
MLGMRSSAQLPLPLPAHRSLSRADLIVASANERAVAFIESWPDWPARAAAIYGPPGCGKTHLVSVWRERSAACVTTAAEIDGQDLRTHEALAIEDVDSSPTSPARDAGLFAALENGRSWILLTGRTPPSAWICQLPDLASRFSALTALPLWSPDEPMLAALARKLFSDRQLFVPDSVIEGMLRRLDRSPAAIREFVAELDAEALATAKPVSLSLVRSLVAAREGDTP